MTMMTMMTSVNLVCIVLILAWIGSGASNEWEAYVWLGNCRSGIVYFSVCILLAMALAED